ncbi:MAG: cytochrome c biosis protein [Frankiales bacterium]|jgi:cytochrome c biogenesis protein|nr:cytochrome c biosis protein [Frankiales bacterium]MDX6213561.1 cytochrome c biosis protein [Frankiales bacterium]
MTETAERPDPTDTAARAALTTKPADVRRAAPARSPWQQARSGWRRLTSMRTALQLLFLLALGAVPGSILPQHGQQDALVTQFINTHWYGPLFDRLSLFDVFAAPWFAAIYLLLFVSLIGCLVPRIRLHYRAMRTPPPAPPRHFAKLPRSTTWETDATPAAALDAVRKALRRKGWRVLVRDEGLSAERGYLRETGNLMFHVSLMLLLAGVAMGGLFGWKGEIIRTPGVGWANVLGQYDESSTGRAFRQSELAPFSVTFNSFKAVYLPTGEPKSYDAYVTYTAHPGAAPKTYDIRENHPLVLGGSWLTGGTKIYLGGHGYAPHLRITDPQGNVVSDEDDVFLPQETTNYLSEGYVKVTNIADKSQWFAIHGVFTPTKAKGAQGQIVSGFPAANDPELLVNALSGDPSADTVYDVPPGMKQMLGADKSTTAGLRVGQSWKLANGYTVTFTGISQFANFQVTDDPGKELALVAAILIVLGLILSLRVRRRRFWVRASLQDGGRTVVEAGGLARTDPEQFADEFSALVDRLRPLTSATGPIVEE